MCLVPVGVDPEVNYQIHGIIFLATPTRPLESLRNNMLIPQPFLLALQKPFYEVRYKHILSGFFCLTLLALSGCGGGGNNGGEVAGITKATAVSVGEFHTCAVLSDGTVQCWGQNAYGQLGNGTTIYNSTTPVTVAGITNATALDVGYLHTCAVLSDGTVKCWGENSHGQLGNGPSFFNFFSPVAVPGVTNAIAVSAGVYHTCAVLSDGPVKCWGNNSAGGLGDGTTINSSTPVTVSGITNATAVVTDDDTCAIISDGTVKCWGENAYGQLGNDATADSSTPVTVSGITTAVAVAVDEHTCALLSDGTIKCWGWNTYGQLGNGTTADSFTPVSVSGITTAVAVAADEHTCALLSDGTIKCWGLNTYGQLGDGTTINSSIPR
jgi:alpha-tubulin suppressor-like RCC1 family protein